MEHLADAPSLAQHLHGDRVHEEGPVVGDDLDHSRAAGGPAVIVLARRPMVMTAREAGRCIAAL